MLVPKLAGGVLDVAGVISYDLQEALLTGNCLVDMSQIENLQAGSVFLILCSPCILCGLGSWLLPFVPGLAIPPKNPVPSCLEHLVMQCSSEASQRDQFDGHVAHVCVTHSHHPDKRRAAWCNCARIEIDRWAWWQPRCTQESEERAMGLVRGALEALVKDDPNKNRIQPVFHLARFSK